MARKPTKKRRADGRFCVRSHGLSFYSTISWADAKRQADAYAKEIAAGLNVNAKNITVAAYAKKWLPLHKAGVGEKTYGEYARIMNKMIDVIGDYPIMSIMPDDAMVVFAKKFPPKKDGQQGYSGSYIRKAKMLYCDFFDSALENGYCNRNPFRSTKVKPVMGEDGTHRAITHEERELIHTVEHPFRLAVMVMLYAGLRRGEVLALNADTDIIGGYIRVSKAVAYVSNQPIIKQPKSEAGKRFVPVFQPLEEALKGVHGLIAPSVKKQKEMTWSAFSSAWASYVTAVECAMNGVAQKRWYGMTRADKERNPSKYLQIIALREAGKKEEAEALRLEGWKRFTVRPHDLRHSFCTMCRDAGVDIKQTIGWMGHADEKMVLRIYDHVTERRTAESIQKVKKIIDSEVNSGQN